MALMRTPSLTGITTCAWLEHPGSGNLQPRGSNSVMERSGRQPSRLAPQESQNLCQDGEGSMKGAALRLPVVSELLSRTILHEYNPPSVWTRIYRLRRGLDGDHLRQARDRLPRGEVAAMGGGPEHHGFVGSRRGPRLALDPGG